jgi:hypothetical protein
LNNLAPHSIFSFLGLLLARLCAHYRAGLLLLAAIPSAAAFSLLGYSWPAGSQVQVHLQLNRPAVALQDGSASWNASAADALATWNQYLFTASFVEGAGAGPAPNDGANSVFFSNTIYADSFPEGVLAVTLNYSNTAGTFTETDVIFNNSIKWNSYRGPIQGSGATATWDLHRVALHEFGHVLGLDHPDQSGQSVAAIMNSILTDLDHLTDDDIAGARSLYGAKITSNLFPPSLNLGASFTYQITASHNPTSFEASPLPPGLQLNTTTGLISGTPTAAGTFNVTIIARAAGKEASATLRIVVIGPTITSPPFPSADIGQSFSYQITASQSASSFTAAGLPPGLSLNAATGLITGIPTVVGPFNVTVTAQTAVGGASGTVRITVLGPRITSTSPPSVEIGGSFSYQITATGQPTSFSATGLPDGLQIDPATGVISGVPTLSGPHQFTVTAHTAYGNVSTKLQIFVKPAPLGPVADLPVAQFPVSFVYALVADPVRGRVYAATYQAIVVIDVASLTVVKTIPLPFSPWDVCLSADGSTLWVATASTTLGRVDLNSLAPLPSLTLEEGAEKVREGLDQRLYISSLLGGVAQVDAVTGAVQARFTPDHTEFRPRCLIEISSDRKTLFAVSLPLVNAQLARYDISGVTPELAQSLLVYFPGQSLGVSHNGNMVSFNPAQAQSALFRSGADLNATLGSVSLGSTYAGPVVFSPDDTTAFQMAINYLTADPSRIAVIDTRTFQISRTIILSDASGGGGSGTKMVVDGTNSYLFYYSGAVFNTASLKVYDVQGAAPKGPPRPRSLLNISTRLRTQGGENVLIGGFIINGLEPKEIVLRAIGPSLPLAGKLADPVLELYNSSGGIISQNNNWNAHRTDVLATGIPPSDEHEAVIVVNLQPGSYTAVVRGANDAGGVALVEAYDLSADSNSRLANISTRGMVESGDNVMIGGFIIGGGEATNVAVRALGPSLGVHGVSGALSDPMLEVYNANGGLMAQDDDWRTFQQQQLIDSGLAPADDRESAMLLSLQPGAYTAIVRGKNGSGVGLVEVYNLDGN